jgi:hypothetical protein
MSSGTRPNIWGFSSAGRALAWHARGHRFDPGNLHQNKKHYAEMCGAFLYHKMCLEHSAECDKRKNNHSAYHGQRTRSHSESSLTQGTGCKNFYSFAPPAKFRLDICGKLWYNAFCNCGYSTSASISAFQAEEVGSIPITRSKKTWTLNGSGLFFLPGGRRTCCKPAAEMLQ